MWTRTDGLAANRPVILLDDAGVALSSGQDPDTIEALGDDTAAFIGAGPAAGRLANAADRRCLPRGVRAAGIFCRPCLLLP